MADRFHISSKELFCAIIDFLNCNYAIRQSIANIVLFTRNLLRVNKLLPFFKKKQIKNYTPLLLFLEQTASMMGW
jgi:hypothetical protein